MRQCEYIHYTPVFDKQTVENMLEEFVLGGAKSLEENHHMIACNNEWLIAHWKLLTQLCYPYRCRGWIRCNVYGMKRLKYVICNMHVRMGMCEHMHNYVHVTRSITVVSFVTVIIYRYILYYINPLWGM